MKPRDYIDPRALAVLDGFAMGFEREAYGDFVRARCPLLTPRARAVLAAVEAVTNGPCVDQCQIQQACDRGDGCIFTPIRQAWKENA